MRNLTSNQKLWGALVVAWVSMLLISLSGAWEVRRVMVEERQNQAKHQTTAALALLSDIASRVERGEMTLDAGQKLAREQLKSIRYDEGRGYLFAFDQQLVNVSHPTIGVGESLSEYKDVDGRLLFALFRDEAKGANGQTLVDYRWTNSQTGEAEDKRSYINHFNAWDWYVGTGVYIVDIDQAFYGKLLTSALSLLGVGALLTLIMGWIIRDFSRSLGGDPRYAAKVVHQIAKGDLTVQPTLRPGDDSSLLAAISGMCARLAQTVGEIQRSADDVNNAAHTFSAGNIELASRTEQQAAALAETASTMEQLTSTVKQNADNADQARSLAFRCAEKARQGGTAMEQVVTSMNAIQQSASQMASIVDAIDSIAFQTNILALNASVEAARAGEQGRGFAVVAGEVRTLASRSAEAAHEIKDLIGRAGKQVQAGSQLVRGTGEIILGVVDDMAHLNTLITEISAASHEQSNGIEQINLAVSEMDRMTQRNAGLVEEAAAESAALVDQAELLENTVAVFKVDAGSAVMRTRPARPKARQDAGAQPGEKSGSTTRAHADAGNAQAPGAVVTEDWDEF